MVEEFSREDVTRIIDEAVQGLLAEAGVGGPPVDALALARHLGLSVRVEDGERKAGRPRRGGGEKEVVLSAGLREEQRQWAAAEAVGEHFRPALLERLGFEPGAGRPLLGGSPARLFAARLLLPNPWFASDAPSCAYDLAQLKERYRTATHEAIAWRLLDLPAPCIITVVDDGRVYRRRSNAWRVRKRLEPAEKECQQHVSKHGEAHEVRAGGWTVRGWPVPQEGWKREVLRSVVEGDSLAGE